MSEKTSGSLAERSPKSGLKTAVSFNTEKVLSAADCKAWESTATSSALGGDQGVEDGSADSKPVKVEVVVPTQEAEEPALERESTVPVTSHCGEVEVAVPEVEQEPGAEKVAEETSDVDEIYDYVETVDVEEATAGGPWNTVHVEERENPKEAVDLHTSSTASGSEGRRYLALETDTDKIMLTDRQSETILRKDSASLESSLNNEQGSIVRTSSKAAELDVLPKPCSKERMGEYHSQKVAVAPALKEKRTRWSLIRAVLHGMKSPKTMPLAPTSHVTVTKDSPSFLELEEEKRVILEQEQILREHKSDERGKVPDHAAVAKGSQESKKNTGDEHMIETYNVEEEPSDRLLRAEEIGEVDGKQALDTDVTEIQRSRGRGLAVEKTASGGGERDNENDWGSDRGRRQKSQDEESQVLEGEVVPESQRNGPERECNKRIHIDEGDNNIQEIEEKQEQVLEGVVDPAYAVNWGVPSRIRKGILEDLEEVEQRHLAAGLIFEERSWSQSSHVAAYCDDVGYQVTEDEDEDSDSEVLLLDPAIGVDWSLPALLREEILENADPLQFQKTGYADLITFMVTWCSGHGEGKGLIGSRLRTNARNTEDWHEVRQQEQWLLSRAVPVSLKRDRGLRGPFSLQSPSMSRSHSEEKQVIVHHRSVNGMVIPMDTQLPKNPTTDHGEDEVDSPERLVGLQTSEDAVNADDIVSGGDPPRSPSVLSEISPLVRGGTSLPTVEVAGDARVVAQRRDDHKPEWISPKPGTVIDTKSRGLDASEASEILHTAPPNTGDLLSWMEMMMGMQETEGAYEQLVHLCCQLKEDLERNKGNSLKLLREKEDFRILCERRERSQQQELAKVARERQELDKQLEEKDRVLVREMEKMERREKEVEAMETAKMRTLMRRLNQMEAQLNEEEDKRMQAERRERALGRELSEIKAGKAREAEVVERLQAAEGRVIQLEAMINARSLLKASTPSGGERRVRTLTRRRVMRGGKLVREELISEPERVVLAEEGTGDAVGKVNGEPVNAQDSETKAQEVELAVRNMSVTLAETRKQLDDAERRASRASRASADAEARAEALEEALVRVQRKLRSWHRVELVDDGKGLAERQDGGGEETKTEVPESLEEREGQLRLARIELGRLRKVNAQLQEIAESRGLALLGIEQKFEEATQRVEELEEALRGLRLDLTAVVEAKLRAEVEADQRREEWEAAARDVEAKSLALQEMKEQIREGEERMKDLESILEQQTPPGSQEEVIVDLKRRLMEAQRRAETILAKLDGSQTALVDAEKEAEQSKKELNSLNARMLEEKEQAEQARKRMADAFDLMLVDLQKRTQVQEQELGALHAELKQKGLKVEELEKEKQEHMDKIGQLMAALKEAEGLSAMVREMEVHMEAAEKRAKDAEIHFAELEATVGVAEAEGAVIREALERAEQEAETRRQDLEMAMKEVQAAEERIREVEEVREEAEKWAEELVMDVESRAVALQGMEERAERAERKGVILAMALSAVEWKVQEVEKKASADVASLRELRAGLEIKAVALEGALREVEDALRQSLEESAEVKKHAAVLEMALLEAEEQVQEAKEKSLLTMKALDTARARLGQANKKSEAIVDQLDKVQRRVIDLGDKNAEEGDEENRREMVLEKVDELRLTLRDTDTLATELWRTCKVAEDDLEQWMSMLEEIGRVSEARAEAREGKARGDIAALAERNAGFEKRAEVLEATLMEVENALKESTTEAKEAMAKVESLEQALKAAEENAQVAQRRAKDADQRADEKAEIARRIAEMASTADAASVSTAAGGKKSVVDERIQNALTEATMAKAESEECRRRLQEMEQQIRETEQRMREEETRALQAARKEAELLRERVQELEGTLEWVEQARAAAAVEMLAAEAIRLPRSDAGEDDSGKRMEALSRQRTDLHGNSFPFDEGEMLDSLPPGWWQTNWPGLLERSPTSPQVLQSSASSRSSDLSASPDVSSLSPLRRRALFLGTMAAEANANSSSKLDPSGRGGQPFALAQGSPGIGKGEAGHKAWVEYLLEGQQGREEQIFSSPISKDLSGKQDKTKTSGGDQPEHPPQRVAAVSW